MGGGHYLSLFRYISPVSLLLTERMKGIHFLLDDAPDRSFICCHEIVLHVFTSIEMF